MATNTNKKPTTSRSKASTTKRNTTRNTRTKSNQKQDGIMYHEINLILTFAVAVFLFLCNFGIIGPFGNQISNVLFGVFGFMAYVFPVLGFIGFLFYSINQGNRGAMIKLISAVVLFFMLSAVFELFQGGDYDAYHIGKIYSYCGENKAGGGVIAGSLYFGLFQLLDLVGTLLLILVISIICIILLTEKSLISGLKKGSSKVVQYSKEDKEKRREYAEQRRIELEEKRRLKEEEKQLRLEEKETEKILRMDQTVTGVDLKPVVELKEKKVPVKKEKKPVNNIHEIIVDSEVIEPVENEIHIAPSRVNSTESIPLTFPTDIENIKVRGVKKEETEVIRPQIVPEKSVSQVEPVVAQKPMVEAATPAPVAVPAAPATMLTASTTSKTYMFPPISRLKKAQTANNGTSEQQLKETALHLQQILQNFGVKVTVTDISQGPSVTRFELQPEMGVKVSKIVGLTDDIKLNLAATDIRIEAPIPGKAAIGIEVPNKENTAVSLRELIEHKNFRDFPSGLSFAVGKDIAGDVIVADIAKMPHMLIAGATGSGKSVCINTLIISILYKAHPDDVKLIMIDPKVVELSVYAGIPHLLIPVVTDPKKAAGALHWGVTEMTERYKKFADTGVRDLKGYNEKLESMRSKGVENVPPKMPQIVIIVDELADLMMVAPGEVEESICRLAQLARAAGIHLIIATQRPSVDVITGLIKANMPSRVAFSVSSGVDSRTILDMNGAEKLLGKGDMLFYPQGYTKPARIQGAFVSDSEVSDVVDFLKNQTIGNVYAEEVQEQIQSLQSQSGTSTSGGGNEDGRDAYFADAGRFVIDKDKASIGMLQRVFKIGFNRAARIMDQLYEYGVVSAEEGTKPRKVLLSPEEFEQLLEEI